MRQGTWVRLADRAVLAATGTEVRPFLQGLVSNDIDRLRPDRAMYAALLTPQGKYLFDFVLMQVGDAIWLDAEAARSAELLRRLTMYRLRAKVVLEDSSEGLAVVALPPETVAGLDHRGSAISWLGGVALVDPRHAGLGIRAVLPRERLGELSALGLTEADHTAYERLRLGLGIPAPPDDLLPQRSLLLESNFEELDGVAFDKGCYVGQELTARTKHRALVRKRLLPVRVEGPLPAPGTPLLLDGREAGEMRSGLNAQGIALIRLEALGGGPSALYAGESRVMPIWPDWLPAAGAGTAG